MILPPMGHVQVPDQSIAAIAETHSIILGVRVAVQIAFGVFAHRCAELAKHSVCAKPMPGFFTETGMCVPRIARVEYDPPPLGA